MASAYFHVADYVVCMAVLALSLGIGLFYGRRGQKSAGEYFMGDRKMNIIPVATSMAVTYLSAITMLGFPAELYYYGVTYWLYIAGRIIGFTGAAYIFVPLMYPLKITSANQYLEMRYKSQPLVVYGSALQIGSVVVTAGAVLYGPAILFEAVSVIPPWACMLLSGLISTIYTSLGGFKGVIATDVFQAIIMMGGLMTVLITGLVRAGGSGKVWQLYKEGGRLEINSIVDPFSHADLFSMLVCAATLDLYGCGIMQAGFQRFSSVPNMRQAKQMFLMAIPPMVIMSSIACITGVIAYAYYSALGCDPLAAGYTKSANGIIPYLVMEILGYPGLPGLFIAACLCGALSNLSSTLNSAAALAWEDFISPRMTNISDQRKNYVIKFTAATFGFVSIAFGFLAMNLSGTILKVTLGLCGASVTPLGLLFSIGAIIPRANWRNAFVTSVTVLVLLATIVIGGAFVTHKSQMLPLTTENCISESANMNSSALHFLNNDTQYNMMVDELTSDSLLTDLVNSTTVQEKDTQDVTGFMKIFHISGLWNVFLGTVLGMLMSFLLTFVPGFSTTSEVNPKLLFPFRRPRKYSEYYDDNDHDNDNDGEKKESFFYQNGRNGLQAVNGDLEKKKPLLINGNFKDELKPKTKEEITKITTI